ncbi:D-amino-acid transaminase [Rubrimonas cliftonensis]|uniref:Probable branched-chain-amino-acid aminotransferase n=1 Tax=Rubrimonas cliftonensis TaxID=89524 RepID=A0A1H4AFW0_9RHOB|nr:D-amino-acid transaminase [Rubrimonas cliftonensis]SEA34963.1 D-alanine transaminase [Rubrimonas cliftonensis]
MSRIVYVNGAFVPEEDAKISVFDRGFLFADGVYEVSTVLDGRLIDNPGHMARLERSLNELGMGSPVPVAEIPALMEELVARNGVAEGMVYLQVTRGAADRDFAFPKDATPSLVMFTQARSVADTAAARDGIKVISAPDMRWARRDIKTVQLLAPSMMKQKAKDAGADDAWMVEDGFVTEGTSNNAYIVTKAGSIVTRQLSTAILHGITRAAVLKLAREAQLKVEERPFTIAEAQDAAEAFYTSASSFVTPVVEIDGAKVGEGRPGPVAKRLRELYIEAARAEAG